jgi:plastocyanin
MLRAVRIVLAMSFIAAGAAACDGDSTDEGGATFTIVMEDFQFDPATRTIDVGTTVRWVNGGSTPHNTTSATQLWQSADLTPGQSFQREFNTAGTFPYSCTLHEGMNGTITVQ